MRARVGGLQHHRDRSYTSKVVGAPFSLAYERVGMDKRQAWWRNSSVSGEFGLGLSHSRSITDDERGMSERATDRIKLG